MKTRSIFYSIVLLLILVTLGSIVAPWLEENRVYNVNLNSGLYRKEITTDKEVYIFGEAVEASFMFSNEAEDSVFVKPIYFHTISAGSVHNPEKITVEVHSTYEKGSRTEIPPGSTIFDRVTFTPLYPGEFEISWLGVSKTVNVTGYKEVSLNSTGISLEIQTSQTEFKIGDQIEVYLVIRNSNQYPVKVPVYQRMTMSSVPLENPRSTMFVEWVMPFFEVDANSTKITWTDRVTLQLPHYSKYWYVDGQQAYIEFEVSP